MQPENEKIAGEPSAGNLLELALIFIRLGFTAFGGPAAHISLFHDEFVKRRKWLDDQHFLDMLGATNLIPGPNSTEMAMHIGYVRAGWRGVFVAGFGFIVPAALIVVVLAGIYVQYGTTPAADGLLYGIKPVIIAIILQAIWNLGSKAIKTWFLGAVGVVALLLALLGINELIVLGGVVLIVVLVEFGRGWRSTISPVLVLVTPAVSLVQRLVETPVAFSLTELFLTFFKIGAVLYGGGYVLLAFLRTDFVERLQWLTDKQLLDAVAIGQFTPGPLFTTATFVGYLTGGVPGSVLATVAIFLPGFILVLLTNPLLPRLRESRFLGVLLDGVNAAAIGLMAAVTLEIAQSALIDPLTIALVVAAAVALLYFKINSTWLIIAGGIIGLVATSLPR